MKKAVLITGIPGTGKSKIAKSIINVCGVLGEESFFKEGLVIGHKLQPFIVFGDYRDKDETFPGMDKASMACSPEYKEYIKTNSPDFFMEGDRLVGNGFIDFLLEEGYDLKVISLKVPQETINERYVQRNSNQDPTFLKSKSTKVSNITARMDLNMDGMLVEMNHVTHLDTDVVLDSIFKFFKD